MKKRLKREWQLYGLLLPGIIWTFIFCYVPLYGLVIAFQKYNPGLGFASPWVGIENFERVFSQPNFIRTIWNTLYMSIFKLAGGIIVPVFFALLLNEVGNSFIKRLFQTIIYIPHFISWVIIAGIFRQILSIDGGLVNNVLQNIGLPAIDFLGSPKVFPWTMIVTDVWKGFGFGTVVYLAALTSIDTELYEAAKIDGATRLQQIRYITFPLLVPTIILMMTLSLGSILNAGFDQIYNLYSPVVYRTGDIIDTFVYRMGIERAQYSVSTAIGLFKSLVSCILVSLSYYLAYKFANYRIL